MLDEQLSSNFHILQLNTFVQSACHNNKHALVCLRVRCFFVDGRTTIPTEREPQKQPTFVLFSIGLDIFAASRNSEGGRGNQESCSIGAACELTAGEAVAYCL